MPSSEWLGTSKVPKITKLDCFLGNKVQAGRRECRLVMVCGMAGWDLYGSLGTISMECVCPCGICLSSIVKVRKGLRHQPDPERRPWEADWVYKGVHYAIVHV